MMFLVVSCSNNTETGNTEVTTETTEETIYSTEGPTDIIIDKVRLFEEADGYTYIEATMQSNIERDDSSTGLYAVPIILIYPHNGGTGVGVVDWPNTSALHNGGFTASADSFSPVRPAFHNLNRCVIRLV